MFDGTQPPYDAIEGKPNPLNFYGKTKLAGEKAIEEVYPEATILRVPILYVLRCVPCAQCRFMPQAIADLIYLYSFSLIGMVPQSIMENLLSTF